MKDTTTMGQRLLKELELEIPSSRNCLQRIPEKRFDWKPHEKSMLMGYLALLVAEIPNWIAHTVEKGEIDFATFTHFQPQTTSELVHHLDENVQRARAALQKASDETLARDFHLKRDGKVLFSMPRGDSVAQSINHLVHHRGQLTVYMRLNNIAVPRIYGPSADEPGF